MPKKLACKRKKCGYKWYPRIYNRLPKECPYCKSMKWNEKE